VQIESILWIALGVSACAFWTASLHLHANLGCAALLCVLGPPAPANTILWRNVDHIQGLVMSIVLPTVLFHAASIWDDHWRIYAQLAVPIVIYPWTTLIPIVVGIIQRDETLLPLIPKALFFVGSRVLLFRLVKNYRSLHAVFTFGEWSVVTCIAAVALSETIFAEHVALNSTYQLVAATGTVGCIIGCALMAKISSVTIRIPLLVGIPLAAVEAAMHWHHIQFPFPRCTNWLIFFLLENDNDDDLWSGVPRISWVVYWFAILLVLVPISTLTAFQELAPAVVTRKWFHFIALLLFTPVTLFSPSLMLLVYAIALCILMVVECVRSELPASVQQFYRTFVDHDKDNPNRVIISHMALVTGCAFPMWLSACTGRESKLLQLWGVMVLGVGDSFGAILGKSFGRTKWGGNRSLEGSFAMLVSLAVCCSFFGEPWLVAVLFTTLLEAFTCQIDNIVLPVSGSVLLLLFSGDT
jgi:dolichol kinase